MAVSAFWAYASWWVRQSMQQLVADLARPVVLSDRAARQLARLKAAKRAHEQVAGHEPSARHVAGVTGLTRETVERLLAAERRPRALEDPVLHDDGPGATFGDQLEDPRSQDPYEAVFDRIDGEGLPRRLDELSERERTVVRSRYGLDGPERTLRELSATLGVSAERVRQIEQGALAKLRR